MFSNNTHCTSKGLCLEYGCYKVQYVTCPSNLINNYHPCPGNLFHFFLFLLVQWTRDSLKVYFHSKLILAKRKYCTEFHERKLLFIGVREWNELPANLKNAPVYVTLKCLINQSYLVYFTFLFSAHQFVNEFVMGLVCNYFFFFNFSSQFLQCCLVLSHICKVY